MNALVERFASDQRWAAWRMVGGRKLPIGKGGKAASIADPATWLTFDEARALVRGVPPERGGVMLALSIEMRLLCVDFDSSVERNRITSEPAREFIRAAQSYTEVSPSRRGLHVWLALAEEWRPARCRLSAGEVYTDKRFMTCTGWSIECDGEYFAIRGQRPRELRTVSVEEARHLLALLGYSESVPAPAQVQVRAATVATIDRIAGLIKFLAAQREGNRNNALYWVARRMREAGISEQEVLYVVEPVARGIGLESAEIARTVKSAFAREAR